jgi:hypothetical protein
MNPELETGSEAHKTGHRWIDLSVAGCALLVSFCSLGLAVHHGKTMERLVEANSRPFLQIIDSNAEPTEEGAYREVLSFQMRNAGAGSARVEWFRIDLDGKPVEDWYAFMRLMQSEVSAASGTDIAATDRGQLMTSDVPQYLQADGRIPSFHWPRTAENTLLWNYVNGVRMTDRLHMQACYCSIFDECWVADSKVFRPKPVEQCEAGSE